MVVDVCGSGFAVRCNKHIPFEAHCYWLAAHLTSLPACFINWAHPFRLIFAKYAQLTSLHICTKVYPTKTGYFRVYPKGLTKWKLIVWSELCIFSEGEASWAASGPRDRCVCRIAEHIQSHEHQQPQHLRGKCYDQMKADSVKYIFMKFLVVTICIANTITGSTQPTPRQLDIFQHRTAPSTQPPCHQLSSKLSTNWWTAYTIPSDRGIQISKQLEGK